MQRENQKEYELGPENDEMTRKYIQDLLALLEQKPENPDHPEPITIEIKVFNFHSDEEEMCAAFFDDNGSRQLVKQGMNDFFKLLTEGRIASPIKLIFNDQDDIIPLPKEVVDQLVLAFIKGCWRPGSTLDLTYIVLNSTIIPLFSTLQHAPANFTLILTKCQPQKDFLAFLAGDFKISPSFILQIKNPDDTGKWGPAAYLALAEMIKKIDVPLGSISFNETPNGFEMNPMLQYFQNTGLGCLLIEAALANPNLSRFGIELDHSEIPTLIKLLKHKRKTLELRVSISEFLGFRAADLNAYPEFAKALSRSHTPLHSLGFSSRIHSFLPFVESLFTNKSLRACYFIETTPLIRSVIHNLRYVDAQRRITYDDGIPDSKQVIPSTEERALFKPSIANINKFLAQYCPLFLPLLNICVEYLGMPDLIMRAWTGFQPSTAKLELSPLFAFNGDNSDIEMPDIQYHPTNALLQAWRNPLVLLSTNPFAAHTTLEHSLADSLAIGLHIPFSANLAPNYFLLLALAKLLPIGLWSLKTGQHSFKVKMLDAKIAKKTKKTLVNELDIGVTSIQVKWLDSFLHFYNVTILNLAMLFFIRGTKLALLNATAHLPQMDNVIDVPSDGNCLYWAVILAWCLESQSLADFTAKYDIAFGAGQVSVEGRTVDVGASETKKYIYNLLKQPMSAITRDPLLEKLICQVFRKRVIERANTFFSDQQREAIALSFGYSSWDNYADVAQKSGTFGGHSEILLISSLIGRNLQVFSNNVRYQVGINNQSKPALKLHHVNAQNNPLGVLNHYRFESTNAEAKAVIQVSKKRKNHDSFTQISDTALTLIAQTPKPRKKTKENPATLPALQ